MSNQDVVRIRWFDGPNDDRTPPVDWRLPALLLATLFLNFPFWYVQEDYLHLSGPPLLYIGVLSGAALLLFALFYLGPALAGYAAKRSMVGLAEMSFGYIPALGLRCCCVLYLISCLALLVSAVITCLFAFPLHRMFSPAVTGLLAGAVLVWLFATGLQSLRTAARLASFTNKLAMAILVAALLRVRGGWSAAFEAVSSRGGGLQTAELWRSLSLLFFWAAPLAFIASDFGNRCKTRVQTTAMGFFGIVLPCIVSLAIIGFIERATQVLRLGRGLSNIAVALCAGDSSRYFSPKIMITAITTFGAIRFGARMVVEALSIFERQKMARWIMLAALVVAIAVLAANIPTDRPAALESLTTLLVAAAAVLTADFLTRSWRAQSLRKVDWIGVVALAAGWAAPCLPLGFYLVTGQDLEMRPDSEYWHPWLVPAYAVSLCTCLLGRSAQRLWNNVNGAGLSRRFGLHP